SRSRDFHPGCCEPPERSDHLREYLLTGRALGSLAQAEQVFGYPSDQRVINGGTGASLMKVGAHHVRNRGQDPFDDIDLSCLDGTGSDTQQWLNPAVQILDYGGWHRITVEACRDGLARDSHHTFERLVDASSLRGHEPRESSPYVRFDHMRQFDWIEEPHHAERGPAERQDDRYSEERGDNDAS